MAKILKYVDNSKIIGFTKSEDDIIELQKVLDEVYEWASNNNINWNNHKFQQVRLGNNYNLKDDTIYFSPGMSHVIEVKEYMKDLGIHVDEKIKYTQTAQGDEVQWYN